VVEVPGHGLELPPVSEGQGDLALGENGRVIHGHLLFEVGQINDLKLVNRRWERGRRSGRRRGRAPLGLVKVLKALLFLGRGGRLFGWRLRRFGRGGARQASPWLAPRWGLSVSRLVHCRGLRKFRGLVEAG